MKNNLSKWTEPDSTQPQRAMKKQRIRIFRRENGVYYSLDTLTQKRHSLETTQLDEARRLINAENEAARQPAINLQIEVAGRGQVSKSGRSTVYGIVHEIS